EAYEGVDFMGALKMLAARAGVALDPANIGRPDPNARIYKAVEEAVRFFEKNLEGSPEARQYLLGRGITEATIKRFSLGWAKPEWRALFDHLSRNGFSSREIITAGLAKQKTEEVGSAGNHPYDVFRERVIFPIFDVSGRPVAFAGRAIGPGDEHTPKYINSPETPVFKKSETLYGFDKAKQSIRGYDFSILVEGPIDLLMTHQAGFTNTVASQGTAITLFHMERLKRISGNIVIALDADDAGIASALKTAKIAMRAGMDVKLATMPEGKDPADIVLEDTEQWRRCIREAKHVIDFLLERIMEKESDTRKAKQRVTREVVPFVVLLGSGIDQAHFISRVAARIGVDDAIVAEEVRRVPQDDIELPEADPTEEMTITRHDRLVRLLSGILFWQEKEERPAIDAVALRADLTGILGNPPETLYPEADRDAVAFEAEVGYQESDRIDRHVAEMLVFLEEHQLKEELALTMNKLTKAEGAGEQAGVLELLNKCKQITDRLNTLQRPA
ncbi:MAG TPA: toprim domain-containing protein, partial [Candidatus Paceibacterota bacterium]|nr:toprim domain-containing protein [Candidatus Paceibacterota bacterium]